MLATRRIDCGTNPTDKLGLRIGAIFVVLVTSLVGALFPVIAKRIRRLRNTGFGIFFEFAKFFGSGIILSTALIHLLQPASYALGPQNTLSLGGCIDDAWAEYPYAFAFCLAALFLTFVGELFAFRIGTAYMARHGVSKKQIRELQAEASAIPAPGDPPAEGDAAGCERARDGGADEEVTGVSTATAAAVPERDIAVKEPMEIGKHSGLDAEEARWTDASEMSPALSQCMGVFLLEIGILFHSLIIGMTLSISPPDEFMTLFVVIIFHQMFEGLGLGVRLSFLNLPHSWRYVPLLGAIAYASITPLGMIIGLGARTSLSMTGEAASIATGVLDGLSAGILLYAATVELIAHEFIFSTYYQTCSWKRVYFVLTSFAAGAIIMSALGKWA